MRKLAIPGTILEKEVGVGFNRAAFAFGAFWYFYKGMWLRGLLYSVIALIVPGFSWILVWIYAGFRANQEYYEHLVKKGYRDLNLPPQPTPAIPQGTPRLEEVSTNNTNKSTVGDKVKMVALATFIVLLVLTGIAVFAPSESGNSPDQDSDKQTTKASAQGDVKSESEQKEEMARQESEREWLDSVAKTYCNEHKNIKFGNSFESFGVNKDLGSSFTLDDCKKIVKELKDLAYKFRLVTKQKSDDSTIKDVLSLIAKGEINMGMSVAEVIAAWGPPKDINETVTQFGVNQQWVYGDVLRNAQYVYLDGEDKTRVKVTSWQDF